MSDSQRVGVDLIFDTSDATNNLGKFASALGIANVGINELVGFTKEALKSLADFAKESVQAYTAQEDAEVNLRQVLVATGNAAGVAADEMIRYASELQNVTKFGDETTVRAEAILGTFKNIGKEVFPQVVESAMDVSTILGTDLKESMRTLGKAMNDPILGMTQLRRVGIQLSEHEEKMITDFVAMNDTASAQKVILDALSTSFGGAARAAAQSASGGFTQLENVVGELKETLGKLPAEAFKPMKQGLIDSATAVRDFMADLITLKLVADKINVPRGFLSSKDLLDIAKAAQEAAKNFEGFRSEAKELSRVANEYNLTIMQQAAYSRMSTQERAAFIEKLKEEREQLEYLNALQAKGTPYPEDTYDIESSRADAQIQEYMRMRANIARISSEPTSFELEGYISQTDIDRINLFVDSMDTLKQVIEEISLGMAQSGLRAYTDTMEMLGGYAADGALSFKEMQSAMASFAMTVLESLPQLFIQAGLMRILAGDLGTGLYLIGLAGLTSFVVGAAKQEANSSSSRTSAATVATTNLSTSQSQKVEIINNTGADVEKRSYVLGNEQVTQLIIGTVKKSIATGGLDDALDIQMHRRKGVNRSL